MAQKLKFTKTFTLRLPEYTHVHITLIGCGGTGSHLASGLVSIAQALGDRGKTCSMMFIDPDRVEPKNVGRQLFSQADIGQPKAQCLANRLNAALGVAIGASVRYIDDVDKFLHADNQALNVVVGAVDNHAARALITKQVTRASGRLWFLNTGNEALSGQAMLGNVTDKKWLKPALGFIDSLPAPSLLYGDLSIAEMKKEKGKRAPSCAELTAAGEQGLMVNRMAAAWALSMLSDFLLGELKYFGVAFNLDQAGLKTWFIDEPTLRGI